MPGHTVEELREKAKALRPPWTTLLQVFSVDASSGTPLFTDDPFVESKECLGGFAAVDVADEEAARPWAGKITVACGWPQEVRRFQVPRQLPETP